jgi:hypothetical protein
MAELYSMEIPFCHHCLVTTCSRLHSIIYQHFRLPCPEQSCLLVTCTQENSDDRIISKDKSIERLLIRSGYPNNRYCLPAGGFLITLPRFIWSRHAHSFATWIGYGKCTAQQIYQDLVSASLLEIIFIDPWSYSCRTVLPSFSSTRGKI